MAVTRKGVRYTRRRKNNSDSSKKIISIFVVVATVIICLAVSVLVGVALGKKAEQYKTESKYDFNFEPYKSGDKTVKAVDAYYYTLGSSAKGYIKNGEGYLSFCIRNSEGDLLFNSDTALEVGISQSGSGLSLKEEIEYLHGLGGYACAYIYSTAFEIEDHYLREIYKAYEIALIREAAECGVDDVLIVGLEIGADNIAEIEKYVSDAAIAATSTPLGVLTTRENIVAADDGIYLASRIRSVCDYLAIDLRAIKAYDEAVDEEDHIAELVEEIKYYVEAYGLRAVLSRENADVRADLIDLGLKNIQIIEK